MNPGAKVFCLLEDVDVVDDIPSDDGDDIPPMNVIDGATHGDECECGSKLHISQSPYHDITSVILKILSYPESLVLSSIK